MNAKLVELIDDWQDRALCLLVVLFWFPGPFLVAAHAHQHPEAGVEAAFAAAFDAYDWPDDNIASQRRGGTDSEVESQ